MKDDQLIASTNPEARANPMIWEGEEAAQGVFLGTQSDDPLAVLGTPSMAPPQAARLPEDFDPSPELRSWLAKLVAGLQGAVDGTPGRALDLDILDEVSVQAVEEILGSGEVQGAVTLDGVRYEICEALLAGIWQLKGSDGSHRVEIGELPACITDAADSLEAARLDAQIEAPGLMNAPAVLLEIADRSTRWQPGDDSHVINFTLMPMSEADQVVLRETLGRADLELESGGFGNCRVYATRYRHVWAVQYLNALGHIILDTLEIGPPPAAVTAAQEDFEDSAARLNEILDTYL